MVTKKTRKNDQIADGTREFTPTPEETRDVVAKMYRARRTIMIRFENDSIDESEGMKDVIQEGKTLLRMRVSRKKREYHRGCGWGRWDGCL